MLGSTTVTLTGTADTDYDEPVVITFEEDADGALVATEFDETRFGSEGLTLYPETATPELPAATEEPAVEATPTPTEEATGN